MFDAFGMCVCVTVSNTHEECHGVFVYVRELQICKSAGDHFF